MNYIIEENLALFIHMLQIIWVFVFSVCGSQLLLKTFQNNTQNLSGAVQEAEHVVRRPAFYFRVASLQTKFTPSPGRP